MDIEDLGQLLLEAARYLVLAQAIVGAGLLAGLVIWRDGYRDSVRRARSDRTA